MRRDLLPLMGSQPVPLEQRRRPIGLQDLPHCQAPPARRSGGSAALAAAINTRTARCRVVVAVRIEHSCRPLEARG